MKNTMTLLGSSLLGLTMFVAPAGASPEGVAVEVTETPTPAPPPAPAPPAVEEEAAVVKRGFYLGGTVGGAFFSGADRNSRIFWDDTSDSNGDGRSDAFTVDSIDDEENFMWSVFFGYRLADWLNAEVGWTDIGGFTATDVNVPGDVTDPPHNDKVKVDVDGIEARLRGWYALPILDERLSIGGGPGIFIFSSHPPKHCAGPDIGACTKGPGHFDDQPPGLDPRHDSGQAFTVSAGLQYAITDNIEIRTEYQCFVQVLDQEVHLVTASVVFGFYDMFGQAGGGDSYGGVVVE